MLKTAKTFRAISLVMLLVFTHSLLFPLPLLGGEVECSYDPQNPTLESARNSFLGLNYECAEKELEDLLKLETLNTEDRADAHVLMAEVYYAKVRNDKEKHDKVIGQFVAAFNSYREWKGELNIKSPDFVAMMKEAQTIVDTSPAEETAEVTQPAGDEEAVAVTEPEPAKEDSSSAGAIVMMSDDSGSKPFYKKWWAIALGVGIVAGAVVLLAGGGGDDDGGGTTGEPLPDFPDPPAKGK